MDPNEITERQLTDHALGEIADPATRRAIEQRIERDAEAAAHVEAVRRLGDEVAGAIAGDADARLTDEQRRRIRGARNRRRTIPRSMKLALAAAAAILLAGVGVALVLPDLGAARRTARHMANAPKGPGTGARAELEADRAARPTEKPDVPGSRLEDKAAPPNAQPPAAQPDAAAREARAGAKGKAAARAAEPRRDASSSRLRARRQASAAADAGAKADAGEGTQLPGRDNRNFNTEQYDEIRDNPFRRASERPLSTFSVDVDTASYTQVRRFLLRENRLPPKNAVRIEEMINYFDYGYEPPDGRPDEGDPPFTAHTAVASAPWNPAHRLVRIGLKGFSPGEARRKPANLVFLLDVSGSMRSPKKLPLLKEAFGKLADRLGSRDRVSIVVYAGASGVVLEPTPGSAEAKIRAALEGLRAGGSTAGASGIRLAYEKAQENFREEAVNRVILATDGDFNVGVTDVGELRRLIQEKARSGVTLSVLGFGAGNIKDDRMETLSNKGNGNYFYIDSAAEAQRVLVEKLTSTLQVIAKDVKLQVELNPAEVRSYRLIGYANRILDKEDFRDDTKDAGDIGAGHDVTAFYEIVPADAEAAGGATRPAVGELKYQRPEALSEAAKSGELLTLKLRYKAPHEKKKQGTSELIAFPVKDGGAGFGDASADFRFGAAVAAFGMLLRDSEHKGKATYAAVAEWARAANAEKSSPQRAQFLELVRKARRLADGAP